MNLYKQEDSPQDETTGHHTPVDIGVSVPGTTQPVPVIVKQRREPSAKDMRVLQARLQDPGATVVDVAKKAGVPRTTAQSILEKWETSWAHHRDEVEPLLQEDIEKYAASRLKSMYDWLTPDKLEAKFERASLRDVVIYEGTWVDKILGMKNQPVQQASSKQMDTIATLAEAIAGELKHRRQDPKVVNEPTNSQ